MYKLKLKWHKNNSIFSPSRLKIELLANLTDLIFFVKFNLVHFLKAKSKPYLKARMYGQTDKRVTTITRTCTLSVHIQ